MRLTSDPHGTVAFRRRVINSLLNFAIHAGAWADPGANVHLLPALNHTPIVDLAIVNVPAECTAIARLVEHGPWVRIVDHELAPELQTISKPN